MLCYNHTLSLSCHLVCYSWPNVTIWNYCIHRFRYILFFFFYLKEVYLRHMRSTTFQFDTRTHTRTPPTTHALCAFTLLEFPIFFSYFGVYNLSRYTKHTEAVTLFFFLFFSSSAINSIGEIGGAGQRPAQSPCRWSCVYIFLRCSHQISTEHLKCEKYLYERDVATLTH